MSVGHVSRAFEAAGIPTVIIMSNVYRGRVIAMKPARVVFTKHLMGRPMSAPFDVGRQQEVLHAALGLLEEAEGPESTLLLPGEYRLAPSN